MLHLTGPYPVVLSSHLSNYFCNCFKISSSAHMGTRRRIPTDLASARRSRAGFTGAVTKALEKLTFMKSDEPEEIQSINTKEVDRLLIALSKTETGFHQSLEESQAFAPEGGEEEEAFITHEDLATETFQDSVSTARDMADRLLALKSILTGLADFKTTSTSIQDFLETNPGSNQSNSLADLKTLYLSLKTIWKGVDLPSTHSLKHELDACANTITSIEDSVAAVLDKAKLHSSSASSSDPHPHPSDHPGYWRSKSDLPVIEVPKFYGNIMAWSTFWNSFESTIGTRKDLDNTQRLHYLRMAIKDEEARKLCYSPTETPDFYLEVVTELKRRYDRTREVHRALTKNILDLQTPKVTRVDLRKMTDQVRRLISSFKATGHYSIDAFLCSTIYLLLPLKLQTSWDQHTKKDKGVPSVDSLLTYLQDHAEALPVSTTDKAGEPPPKKAVNSKPSQQPRGNRNPANSVTPTAKPYKWECNLCHPEKHPLYICPKWVAFSLSQKLAHIAAKGLCSNCLAGGHATTACKSSYRCRDCSQMHHTSIHQHSTSTSPVNSTIATCHQVPDALMTTAEVLLVGPRGQSVKARALIDSGAGLSLLSHKIAQTLGLPLHPSNLQLTGVQGTNCKPVKYLSELSISPLHNREMKIKCTPAIVQVVTATLPPEKVEPVTDMPHLMGLHLADEHYNIPGRIDILLGADLAPKIMTKMVLRTGGDNEPMAQATEFGWVISGPATRSQPASGSPSASIHHLQPEEASPPLHQLLYEFWGGEETPGDEETTLSQTEEQAEQHYELNTVYLPSQSRYQVTLPKKPDSLALGDSKPQAVSRFFSSHRSATKRGLLEPYQKVVQGYLDLGHAEPVPPSEPPPVCSYYLPMHFVTKDSSTTTKLRVVFDGSATTTSGTSLNQSLLVGPTIQPTLSAILLKFRCYPVALNADISKMYREVLLHPADKDLHRFVWRASPADQLSETGCAG